MSENKSQNVSKLHMIFYVIFDFITGLYTCLNQSTLTRNSWNFIQTILRLCNIYPLMQISS